MPPKKTKQSKLSFEVPSEKQIIEFNALLRRTENLAKQLNAPVTSTIFVLLVGAWQEVVFNYAISALLPFLDELQEQNYWIFATFISFAIPPIYYGYYQLFKGLSNLLLKFLPNGVGFSLEMLPAYKAQEKLPSNAEIQRLIKELNELISKQESRLSKQKWANFFISIVIPYFASISFKNGLIIPSGSLSLYHSSLGPFIAFKSSHYSSESFDYLQGICGRVQATSSVQWAVRLYSNYNIPKQLFHFIAQLNKITSNDLAWQSLNTKHIKYSNNKEAQIAMLSISSKEITLKWWADKKSILSKVFINELYRIFLNENLPVYYFPGENTIYLGLCNISRSQERRISSTFMLRLAEYKHLESNADQILICLNAIANNIEKNLWEYAIKVSKENEYFVMFWCDLYKIRDYWQLHSHYKNIICRIIPDRYLTIDMNIIKIELPIYILENIHAYILEEIHIKNSRNVQKEFSESLTELKGRQNLNETDSLSLKKHSPENKIGKKETEDESKKCSLKKENFSKKIQFSNGITFFEENTKKNQSSAYPIQIPYIRKNHALAHVDLRVYSRVENYLSEKEINARLERGSVFGSKKGEKNKYGAEGIKLINKPTSYKNIDGQIYNAALKLKFFNGIRIFGRYVEEISLDKERYVLYEFDGPVYGHKRGN